MLWYHKELKLAIDKKLCFHEFITQQNFTNTIHINKDPHLSPESEIVITDAVKTSEKIMTQEW